MTAHDYIRTGDADSFPAICDGRGLVVLSYCRRCRRAEAELSAHCPGAPNAPATFEVYDATARAWLGGLTEADLSARQDAPRGTTAPAPRAQVLAPDVQLCGVYDRYTHAWCTLAAGHDKREPHRAGVMPLEARRPAHPSICLTGAQFTLPPRWEAAAGLVLALPLPPRDEPAARAGELHNAFTLAPHHAPRSQAAEPVATIAAWRRRMLGGSK